MTLPMALLDFVPVVLFIIAAIVLQRGLYDKMSKGAFSLLSAGTIMVISAGIMKATWKLLMALEICDFERLNNCFFPMQSVGFLLAGISVVALVFFPQEKKEAAYAAAAPAVFQGTMIFVTLMILGCLGFCGGLGIYAARKKKTLSAVLFWVAFVLMLGMGYLSSRDFSESSMNWIAECVNVVGEGILLTASVKLFKD
ncbi:MAG TPA: hypothetical protein DCW41_02325 [Clostridiales bacterium]|nr:hypothetical protein [Clostridiales bacterium]